MDHFGLYRSRMSQEGWGVIGGNELLNTKYKVSGGS